MISLFKEYDAARFNLLNRLKANREKLAKGLISPAHFENMRLIYQSGLAKIRSIYYA